LICGGGTGGHIYPALSVAAKLQENGLTADDFLWIGTRGEIEESLVPQAGLHLATISGGALAGVSWPVRMRNVARLGAGLAAAVRHLHAFRPDVGLLTGGYVNGPVAVAARSRRVPLAIYLPDIEPGKAIRTLSRFARVVACTAAPSLAFFAPGKAMVTGYPVRPEIRAARQLGKAEALDRFELGNGRPTLFVFGGSRGARSINRALTAALTTLLETMQVIHVGGTLDWPEVRDGAAALPEAQRDFYRPFPYLHEEMGPAFRAADLVVARAGASMLGECPAFGLPAILVPYPYAWRYQKVNADYLVERGAAVRLDDERLSDGLVPTVTGLLGNESRLGSMAAAARQLDQPEAADRLAQLVLNIGRGLAT
jgi:UDP-N-acetylglucosamine--N-acetylmuramyl-(pentapeptide) pyrophosphoryl-undecaprenol N-acetylglucosamine transferase